MRVMIVVVLCLGTILSCNAGAHGEPACQPTISFAAPGNIANKGTGYLLGSFKAGLTVSLITETGICRAKTGATFSYEHMGPDDLIEATTVVGIEECPKPATIAIVGVDPTRVRLIQPKDGQFLIPRDVELRARRLVEREGSDPESWYSVTGSRPEVLMVEGFMYLRFQLKGEENHGPALLFFNDEFFELEGGCTSRPVFFFVNDKLHLAYAENGCGSGQLMFVVYDLSDGSPRIVYTNADLST